jgi:hypothetical protein
VPRILEGESLSVAALRAHVDGALSRTPRVEGAAAEIYPSPTTERVLVRAKDQALERYGRDLVDWPVAARLTR